MCAMFVRGDWTRRGLGRAILDGCQRAARAEGFKKLVLGATLPGEPLYRAFGFREIERFMVTMPDGMSVEAVAMERPIQPVADGHAECVLPRWTSHRARTSTLDVATTDAADPTASSR